MSQKNCLWSPPNELLVPRWEGHSLPQPSFCWGRSGTLDIYTFPSVFFQPICQCAGSHSLSFQGLRLQASLRTKSWINPEQGHLSTWVTLAWSFSLGGTPSSRSPTRSRCGWGVACEKENCFSFRQSVFLHLLEEGEVWTESTNVFVNLQEHVVVPVETEFWKEISIRKEKWKY